MQLLEERIRKEGEVIPPDILKVSSFLNHQIDIGLLDKMAEEFKRLFDPAKVTKILTLEASGIAIAASVARLYGVPMVFAKKGKTSNVNDSVYSSQIWSFTHNKEYTAIVSKKFITKDDFVLIIDDFLANGAALKGLVDIVQQAQANLVGAGIAIEKTFQDGGANLRKQGIKIESLAMIESMSVDAGITFKR